MGTNDDEAATAGVDGDPVYCNDCDAPVVLYTVPKQGYKLVCACPQTSVALGTETMRSTLFEPLSGRWSQLDDVDRGGIDEWD